jgi:hypothetical protein
MSVSKCVQTLPLTFHANELGPPMYRVSESIRSAHGQDGAVVLDIRQGQMFNLNFVGSRILELLKAGSTELEIIREIGQEFSISPDHARSDLLEFLKTLEQHQLIENHERNGKP